jgi:three-Cys-motif partner protein
MPTLSLMNTFGWPLDNIAATLEQITNTRTAAMLDDDGLPLVEVGSWAKEKHERLRQYVDITREVRRKFVEGAGGATYIDLYCGSGRAIIRDTSEKIDGSPLVAFKSALDGGVPFSEIHIADESEEFCRAAERRISNAGGAPKTDVGKAEETVAGSSSG